MKILIRNLFALLLHVTLSQTEEGNVLCSKLVQPKSELGSGLDQFRTGPDSDLGLDTCI